MSGWIKHPNALCDYGVPKGGKGVVRPHAPTTMTTTAPGQAATTTDYRYDGSGNMICRPTAGSTGNDCDTNADSQTLAWDAEDELATVTAGGKAVESNVYDVDGARLIRRDATGTTLYLPGQEVRRQGSTTTGTRYYTFAGTICGSRKASSEPTAMTWLFTDHQGTQQIAVNAGTQAVTNRRQTPYGAPRGTNPAWANEKGFVGGDNDPTGLVNIGARRYDTALGRFISVDPVMDLADPQQWNAYSYAYNSPVSHADPSGEDPCPGGGGGCYYDGTTTEHDGITKQQMDNGREESKRIVAEVRHEQTVERQQQQVQQRHEVQERARKHKECQASFWCRQGQKATNFASAGMDFMVKHADVVGVIAGVGVGLGCTVLTGGGGAVLCGALGGAVTGLVAAGLKCKGGDESKCGAGNLLTETAIGGVMGAFGGGVGAVGGGLLKVACPVRDLR